MTRYLRGLLGTVALVCPAITTAACTRTASGPSADPKSVPSAPTRISVIATGSVSGYLEPCGCVKDQLGGLDRFAAAVRQVRQKNPTLLVTTGALFFPRPQIEPAEKSEVLLRAETLARVWRSIDGFAWVPNQADLALGADTTARLIELSGLRPLPNMERFQSASASRGGDSECTTSNVGPVRVGVCGTVGGAMTPQSLEDNLRAQAAKLSTQNASLKIALLDTDTGSALRAADRVPDFHLFVVSGGSGGVIGADSDGAEPVRVQQTLVVHPPNHLRGLITVEFNIRDSQFVFDDATGVGRDIERKQVAERIRELSERLSVWKKQNQDPAMIRSRQEDLARLQLRAADLSRPLAAPEGSYFTVLTTEIGSGVAGDPSVRRTLDELGRRINDGNRERFAGRKAPEPAAGQAGFVGVGSCETCHEQAAQFWRKTRHASAYQTLVKAEREFTLDCVGCHVTGYEMPGGSTVTDVAGLKNVQCENCHGPGSIHASTRAARDIQRRPKRELCAQRCHHSPHVAPTWSVNDAWPKILGPGHGD